MSFFTSFEMTVRQFDLLPLETDVIICHSERSEESNNFSRSVVMQKPYIKSTLITKMPHYQNLIVRFVKKRACIR